MLDRKRDLVLQDESTREVNGAGDPAPAVNGFVQHCECTLCY